MSAQESLAQLAAHAKLIGRVQRAYEKFLPPELTGVSRVLNVKQGVVVVSASSGAVANRLKQLLPSARMALKECCGEVTEVRVKVQAFEPDRLPARTAVRPVSAEARNQLVRGAQALAPDSALRQALEQLLKRSRT
ncbi:MAG TPA: DciA family protein [Methyloversatilis sp.]